MWRPLAEKFPRNPRIFFGNPIGPLGLYKKIEDRIPKFPTVFEKFGKNRISILPIFKVVYED